MRCASKMGRLCTTTITCGQSSFWQTRRTVDRFTMLVGMIREVSQARLAQHVLDLLALRSQSLFIMFLSSSVSTQRAMKPKYLHKPIHLRDLKP